MYLSNEVFVLHYFPTLEVSIITLEKVSFPFPSSLCTAASKKGWLDRIQRTISDLSAVVKQPSTFSPETFSKLLLRPDQHYGHVLFAQLSLMWLTKVNLHLLITILGLEGFSWNKERTELLGSSGDIFISRKVQCDTRSLVLFKG